MKTVIHIKEARDKILHIETDMAIIHLRAGHTNTDGSPVETIEIRLDNDVYFDSVTKEPKDWLMVRLTKNQ